MKKKIITVLLIITLGVATTAISYLVCTKSKGIQSMLLSTTKTPEKDISRSDIKDIVNSYYSQKLKDTKISFSSDRFSDSYTMYETGCMYDIDSLTNEAVKLSKDKKISTNKDKITKMITKDNVLKAKVLVKKDDFKLFTDKLSEHVNKKVKKPSVSFANNKVHLSGGEDGYSLNSDALYQNLSDAVKNDNTNLNVKIPIDTLAGSVSEDIQNKMSVLGTYTTTLTSLNANRTNNINLFLNKLNGSLILPDETFSCDKAAGRRELADGYKPAPAFAESKVQDAVAGGICQGVSTLYNAVLFADLKVVERAPHMFVVSYAPIGRDATIASGSIDFKFKNNKKYPIIVQCYVSNKTVSASIWGVNEEPNKKIEISVEQLGPRSSKTYKKTLIDNKVVKTELISTDTYKTPS